MSSRGRTMERRVRRRTGPSPSAARSASLGVRSRSLSSVRTAPSRSRSTASRLTRLESMIETKEGCRRISNVQLPHNGCVVLNDTIGNVFNPFQSNQGVTDPMSAGELVRIGDKITIRGMKFKFFVEGSLGRSKVYIRFFLVRMAKGDTLNRGTFYKDCCGNKMIDQVNTERYTILASKRVSLSAPNATALNLAAVTGLPSAETASGITGNAIFTMWVPGRKFGRGGNITYENNSTSQVKFYDYRLVATAYDWYGTPQDTNNVAYINDGYVKVYFKDA